MSDRDVDWFRDLKRAGTSPEHGEPPFGVSLDEYAPGHVDVPEAPKTPAPGPADRISRARHHRPDDDATQPLRDIARATLALTREDWRSQRALPPEDGDRMAETADGARAEGDGLSASVAPARPDRRPCRRS